MKTWFERTVEGLKIGQKVIVRSNEDDPLKIGTYQGFELITLAKQPCPVVEFDDGKFLVMGIIKPYSDELKEKLDKLTPKEQWNSLSENYKRI